MWSHVLHVVVFSFRVAVLGCHEAVAEFIDNAIEASRGQKQQEITIHLFVASDDEKVGKWHLTD